MRAVVFDTPGGPDVLRTAELPRPVAAPDDVVVRVSHMAVNPADTMLRAGLIPAPAGTAPHVPGWDLAGTVESAPEGSHLLPGDRVMAAVSPLRHQGGSHAEFVAVPASSIMPTPAGWDASQAAVVPMNALTAVQALRLGEATEADTVLVTGAAGVLGGFVVDLLTETDAQVYVDSAPPLSDPEDYLTVLGRGPGLEERLRRHLPAGVDLAIDCAVTGAEAEAAVHDNGRLVCVRPHEGPGLRGVRIERTQVALVLTDRDAVDRVADAAAGGILRPLVADVVSYDRAREAHSRLEQGGLRGRIVLSFDET